MSGGSLFYEIEYDDCPIPGVGKFVLKQQKVEPPDETRRLFSQMRDIARPYGGTSYRLPKQYIGAGLNEKIAFRKQAEFMASYTDNYTGFAAFDRYYPSYQAMGYEQLRTYFTWRTRVREGDIKETSLSYAFVYIYELLSQTGAKDKQDALDKLVAFWKAYREYNTKIDKYFYKWVKDYHIYYDLPFKDFVIKEGLQEHYPEVFEQSSGFKTYAELSKYSIERSSFYTGEYITLYQDCFMFVAECLNNIFKRDVLDYLNSPFFWGGEQDVSVRNRFTWIPFDGALFYDNQKQKDRYYTISNSEIYFYTNEAWTQTKRLYFSASCKEAITYIIKKTEAELRRAVKHKHKLKVCPPPAVSDILNKEGINLETVIETAVIDFYAQKSRITVSVDINALEKLRRETAKVQKKLTVEEPDPAENTLVIPDIKTHAPALQTPSGPAPDAQKPAVLRPASPEYAALAPAASPLNAFINALTAIEKGALTIIITGKSLSDYALKHDVMPEILADSINAKALDYISDAVLDDAFNIYEDYFPEIEGLIK